MDKKIEKVKKEILGEIEIPNEIEVKINDFMEVKGPKGEMKRRLRAPKITIEQKDKKIIISTKKVTKREKKIVCTIKSHINNMFKGVKEPFVYKLQICSVHFPMTVNIDQEKNLLIIKNFLGEVKERKAKLLPGVDIKVEKDIITVESCDIEKAGQTAANIEGTTKIKGRDKRIFQDGIFITSKAGIEV